MNSYNFEVKEPPNDPTEFHLHDAVVIHGEHVIDFNEKLDPDKYYLFGSISSDRYLPVIMGPFTEKILDVVNNSQKE